MFFYIFLLIFFLLIFFFFFFNDTATTEIYTLSLHDALPITRYCDERRMSNRQRLELFLQVCDAVAQDRKSTRLNSSHVEIPYAVCCLKKKKQNCNQDLNHDHVHRTQLVTTHYHSI